MPDLLDRLSGLAPDVDTDEGARLLPRVRARRPGLLVVPAVVVALLAIGLAVVLRDDGGEPEQVTAGPSDEITATTTQDGIELTVTIPQAEVEVGTRVHADVTIRNIGDVPVYWTHGGCAVPASVSLAPSRTWIPGVTNPAAYQWDGTFLADRLVKWNMLEPPAFVEAASAGVRKIACTLQLIVETIQPGEAITWSGVADVRVPPGSVEFALTAYFAGYRQPADYPDSPREPVIVSVPVPVVDDRVRAVTADRAVALMEADPRLAAFLSSSRDEAPENAQHWTPELSWWQGGWELLVTPYFSEGQQQSLRLRYDPTDDRIIDARLVDPGQPPGDDPDGNNYPGQPPDTILP